MSCGHDLAGTIPVTPSCEQASARTHALSLFRIYDEDELGADGYPFAWHKGPLAELQTLNKVDVQRAVIQKAIVAKGGAIGIKDIVRAQADNRCERCHHPYRNGEHGSGEWTPCDMHCTHERTDSRWLINGEWYFWEDEPWRISDIEEAQWRILTVHHLNGVKADCRWWNLSALCQRCHLTIQGRVVMNRAFILEHSDWFKPHAAGFYADKYLGEQLTREETIARLDELLALERLA